MGQQFTQARNKPFLQTPLIELLGETGFQSQAFNHILAGTFDKTTVCDPYANKLLTTLQKSNGVVSPLPSHQDYQQSWKKSCKTMASSPSQMHFGQYIAGTNHFLKLNAILMEMSTSSLWLLTGMLETWIECYVRKKLLGIMRSNGSGLFCCLKWIAI